MVGSLQKKYTSLFLLLSLSATLSTHAYKEIDSAFFENAHKNTKTIITFLGFSALDYEHPDAMLRKTRELLQKLDAQSTIIAIGATPDGIGSIYEVAHNLGFDTVGIVSSQCQTDNCTYSPFVNSILFVNDTQYGGYVSASKKLSPTSEMVVSVSDRIIAFGGGQVAADELSEALKRSIPVEFFAFEMNHEKMKERAHKKGLPEPHNFAGEAYGMWQESQKIKS